MQLCDIGVNLTSNRFAHDWRDCIIRAADVGVAKLIITGTDVAASETAIHLANQYPHHCYATAGIHPHHAKEAVDNSGRCNFRQQLTDLAGHSAVVAIGECGLDFNRNFSPKNVQLQVFEAQLELAVELRMPVFLHERDAFQEQLLLLKKYRSRMVGGVVHCFTGNRQQLEAYLDLDFYIGITGWLCDPRRGTELRDAVKALPLSRLLLETDAPYLTPKTLPSSVKRNEPCHLPHIAEQLTGIVNASADANAELLTVKHIADASYQNSLQLFKLSSN